MKEVTRRVSNKEKLWANCSFDILREEWIALTKTQGTQDDSFFIMTLILNAGEKNLQKAVSHIVLDACFC